MARLKNGAKVNIKGQVFTHQDGLYVLYQKETDIMLTPITPGDKHTRWEIFLHKKDGNIIDSTSSFSKDAAVTIAIARKWFEVQS